MARASAVYSVLANGQIIAGFTVKHELKSWYTRRKDDDKTLWTVVRCTDGGRGEPVRYPITEFK